MKMTAYQRRLREIKYWRQRGQDLEDIILAMAQYMKDHDLEPVIPLTGSGIEGDQFINDINTGDFAMRMFSKFAGMRKTRTRHER